MLSLPEPQKFPSHWRNNVGYKIGPVQDPFLSEPGQEEFFLFQRQNLIAIGKELSMLGETLS
jgi:hypothetical protein